MTKNKNIVSVPSSKTGEPDKQYQKVRGKWIDLSTNKEAPSNFVDMLETYLQIENPEYRKEKEKKELPEFTSSLSVKDTNNIERLTESISKLTKTLESIGKITNSRIIKREKGIPSIEPINQKPKIEPDVKKGYEKVVSESGQVNYKNKETGKFVKKEEATKIPSTFEMAKRIYGPALSTSIKGSENKYGETTSPGIGRQFLEKVFPLSAFAFGARDAKKSVIADQLREYESNIRKNPKNKKLSDEQIDEMIQKKKNDITNQKISSLVPVVPKSNNGQPTATSSVSATPKSNNGPSIPPTEKIDVRTLDKENPETPGKENRPAPISEVSIINVSDNILQKLAEILKKNIGQEKQPSEEGPPSPGGPGFNPFDFLNGGKGKRTPTPKGPSSKPPILDKNGKPLRGAALKSAEKKAAEKAGVKAAEKAGVKAGLETGGKVLGKSLLKKIPLIGAGAGLVFGAQRLMEGDYLGAGGEVASGLASTVPGFGTAASLGIDAALAARDISNAYSSEKEPAIDANMIKPPVNNQTQNVAMANKQNQIFKDNKMNQPASTPTAFNNITNAPSSIINNNTVANLPTAGPRGSLDLSKFA